MAVAMDYGIETEGREVKDIAIELGEKALGQYGQQDGELINIKRALSNARKSGEMKALFLKDAIGRS